jgi:hypothetical protein
MIRAIVQIAVGVVFIAVAPFDYLIHEWWQFGILLVTGFLFLGVSLRSLLREKTS